MNDQHLMNDGEKADNDPEENLRIENEILKLKLQAETGAVFGSSGDLPPELENMFLQNISNFEAAWQNEKQEKLYIKLGQPEWKKAEDLSPSEIEIELDKIQSIMAEHNTVLDVLGEYEPVVIYRFITEELFEHSEMGGMSMPGMTCHYIYEEFHPNHKMDIERTAKDFLLHWFDQQFDEYSTELSTKFILPDGRLLSKEETMAKFTNYFNCYRRFYDYGFNIDDIQFQWNDNTGIGHAEGSLTHKAEMENGEVITMQGPYKLYMSNEYGGWDIFYFIMPGFVW